MSTADLTVKFIKEHPHINNCLKKGLINYSALARYIAESLKITKKTSIEAILVAARRYNEKQKSTAKHEQKIRKILSDSDLSIKNKIHVFILDRSASVDHLTSVQQKVKKYAGVFYMLEGSDNYTVILQQKHAHLITSSIIKHHKDLVLINLSSPKTIESTEGVVAFITSLFSENGVNILEFLSCWTDTLFIIQEKDLQKTIKFLDF